MRRIQNRGIFALENENLETPPPVEEPEVIAELPQHSESAEADVAALNTEEGEINETDASIDEAVDSVQALEAIRETLIEADKEGGLSRAGARLLKVSLEHIYGRLGIPTDKVMPALESFGGSAGRQESTQVALEDIQEQAGNVWKKIVEWAKKIWEWIKSWYAKLFDTNTKVIARAKALKEAADKLTDAEPKSTEIQNASLAKNLIITTDAGGEGVDGKAVLEHVESFAGEWAGNAKKYFDNLERLLKAVEEGKTVDLKPEEMNLGLKPVEEGAASKLGVKLAAGSKIFASEQLPGGKFFVSAWGGTVESSFVGLVDHSAKAEAANLPVLSKEVIIQLAEKVGSIAEKVASTKTAVEGADGALKALIGAGEKHMEAAGKEADEQGKSSVALARTAQKLIASAATAANKYLLDTCLNLLAWGEQSVKAHTGGALGNAAEKVGEKVGEAADKVGEAVNKGREKVAGAIAPKKDDKPAEEPKK
jgi:hypothetical protein